MDASSYTHTMTRQRLDAIEAHLEQLQLPKAFFDGEQLVQLEERICQAREADSAAIDPAAVLALLLELVRIIRGQ